MGMWTPVHVHLSKGVMVGMRTILKPIIATRDSLQGRPMHDKSEHKLQALVYDILPSTTAVFSRVQKTVS